MMLRTGGPLTWRLVVTLYHIVERFPGREARDLLGGHPVGPRLGPLDTRRDMRGKQQVGRCPQWMTCWWGLRLGHVECRAEASAHQLRDQRVGVHDLAAGRVHQYGTVPHSGQEGRVDHSGRGYGEWH